MTRPAPSNENVDARPLGSRPDTKPVALVALSVVYAGWFALLVWMAVQRAVQS